jgi:hypothetical protein
MAVVKLGAMTADPALSLAEWVVLGVVAEQPTHGFPIAQLTAHDGELVRSGTCPGRSCTGRYPGSRTPG